MNKILNKIFGHDGCLPDLTLSIGAARKMVIRLSPLFYKDKHASSRNAYQIICKSMSHFNNTLDGVKLKNNMPTGDISDGYLKNDVFGAISLMVCSKLAPKIFTLLKAKYLLN